MYMHAHVKIISRILVRIIQREKLIFKMIKNFQMEVGNINHTFV